MSTSFEFGKDRYHLQKTMIAWCEEHIGPGSWIFNQSPKDWTGLSAANGEPAVWTISSVFGNTFFAFKDEKDATMFSLRWQ